MSVEMEHFYDDDLDVSARDNPIGDRIEVLVLVGRHHCGWHGWRLAPDWKVPADLGGGFYADNCPNCLGAAEWDEQWWPKSEFVE